MSQNQQIAYLQELNKDLLKDLTRMDLKVSQLLRISTRQRKAFKLLVDLQKEIGKARNDGDFLSAVTKLINATLELTATYIYKPSKEDPEKFEIVDFHIANKNKRKFSTVIQHVEIRNISEFKDYLLLNQQSLQENPFSYLKEVFHLESLILSPVLYNEDICYLIVTGQHIIDHNQYPDLNEEYAHAIEAVGILISSYLRKSELIKLYETDKIKTEFISNLSHEFRTPLTLVLGLLEDLKNKYKDELSREDSDSFEVVLKSAFRIRQLIDQLLDISKLETETERLAVRQIDLGDFIHRISSSFATLARKQRIDFHTHFNFSSAETWFDEDKLEKIVTNLLSNAFKFTPEGGRVNLVLMEESSGEKTTIQVEVNDTGPGIPLKEQKLIFDRFYQVKNDVAGKSEGTGVGLYLVKKLTGLHHGTVELKSKPGKGSSFSIHIPVNSGEYTDEEKLRPLKEIESIKDQHTAILERETGTTESRQNKGKRAHRILIVEDNRDLNAFIAANLSAIFEVISAFDGKEGLEKAEDTIPDLIISDVMMPVMDGVKMTRRIKSGEKTCHIPVILLTAKADRTSRYQGFEGGAEDYIVKPFDMNELVLKVRNQIDNSLRIREKARKEILSAPVETEPESADDQLVRSVLMLIRKNIDNPDFQVKDLCEKLFLSRSQLFRKIDALTGYTPAELIRTIRLKTAASMFSNGSGNVAGVMYEVGFNNQSNFARNFRRQYGVNPSEYIQQERAHT